MNHDSVIDYVELPARDLAAIEDFYNTVFGWTFTDYGPDYCSFSDGRLAGGFYRADATSSTRQGAALVVLYTEELEDAHQRVQAAGGQIVRDIFGFPGGRRFHFADPNGNELAVWSPV
ncbi:VOC family protein [Chitinolyticbacter meiyuanensis]|uniref:VOC family protein n=1 Tax=Chitinolyticbacter meiyuanensis TaxID=682798 RepID=UPI0011E5B0F2|nr:VOC family protein [Chitinolyticbacter meiyuanensis]